MSLFPKVGRKQPSVRFAWRATVALLILGVVLHLFPFYYMLVLSITPARETLSPTLRFFPEEPTLSAWRLVFDIATRTSMDTNVRDLMRYPLYVYFFNSLFMTLTTLLISLPVTSLAAYANSKLQRGPIARWSFLFFIGTLMVPGVVTLIPSFLMTRNFPFPLPNPPLIPGTNDPFPIIRIWDTAWGVIIPGVFSAFNFLLFKGFFDTIPDSIIQAARVDGGSEFNIFRRIVFPMSIPVYAVAGWLQFGGVWDSYLWPLVIFQTPDRLPMSVAISNLMNRFIQAGSTSAEQASAMTESMREILEAGLSWNGLMVLGLLQTLPIFIAFIICRKYLMKGIRLRGLK
jgi:ABC-type glycerol-3-phosphate transport system permease component